MREYRQAALRLGAALVALAAAGCGDNNAVYPVRGRVTFEGKPLPGGGSIALFPLDNRPGKTAGGEVAEDGTYELTTYREGDGSMPGEFRVVVFQVTEREPATSVDGREPTREEVGVPISIVAKADRIPPVYADHQHSPLRATVAAKGANEINVDLKRKPE